MKKVLKGVLAGFTTLTSLALTAWLLTMVAMSPGGKGSGIAPEAQDIAAIDRFDMLMTNEISTALEGVLSIEKVYWLSDNELIAPEPNQELFGVTDDPATLAWLLEDAGELLEGQTTLFQPDTEILKDSRVNYYLDETILAITWKLPYQGSVYTVSEVKIAHPSQFRRFLAGGQYSSGIQLLTSQMAQSVNAVVASSGDFYTYRRRGVIVYDGVVQRVDSEGVDTCYIDANGDLIFSYRDELPDMESAQAFVDEHDIRFSLAFGPILMDDGQAVDPGIYILGEIWGEFSRAALCQMGPLHYLLVTAGDEPPYYKECPTMFQFQRMIVSFGCEKAYALDGGQTATLIMNDQMMNRVLYGMPERDISDIIYFATAIPN